MKTMKKTYSIFSTHRDGISIIEVLTSLAVAAIGVFGVLVLIPFAVKQAQIGLDQDAADLIGRNALEDLQTYGYTSVLDNGQLALRGTKVLVESTGNLVMTPQAEILGAPNVGMPPNFSPQNVVGLNAANPRIIHFDPLAVGRLGFPDSVRDDNPDVLTGDLPAMDGMANQRNDLRVTLATGIVRTGTGGGSGLLNFAESVRLFQTEDDLVIGDRNFLLPNTVDDAEAESGVDLPQPVFDVSANGHLMRRQSLGRISWSALYVPFKDTNRVKPSATAPPTVATKYKVYILVYKDRVPGDADSVMNASLVNRHAIGQIGDPNFENTTNGGFTPAVSQIHLPVSSEGVFKDDWVMLINRKPAPDYADARVTGLGLSIMSPVGRLDAEESGYDVQVGFAKVLSVLSRDAPVMPSNTVTTMTVEGGPFDFYYSDISGGTYGVNALTGASDDAFTTATYAIHLKNVINVYERTITLERDSIWN